MHVWEEVEGYVYVHTFYLHMYLIEKLLWLKAVKKDWDKAKFLTFKAVMEDVGFQIIWAIQLCECA